MSKIFCCGFAGLAPTTSSCGICRACRRLWKTYGRDDPPTSFPQPPWKAAPRRRSAPYHSHLEKRGRFPTATHRNDDYDAIFSLGKRDSDNNLCSPSSEYALTSPVPRAEKSRGSLEKTACISYPQDADFLQHKYRWQAGKHFRRLGMGDFVRASDTEEDFFLSQSACQMEAPYLCRIPIMHLVFSFKTSQSANKSTTDHPLSQSINHLEVN